MISIFNGQRRYRGQAEQSVWAQIDVDFRKYLHLFKGAKLAVFLAVALHADQKGWAFPSIELLKEETGYNEDTISDALTALCQTEIDGQRVLARGQPRKSTTNQWTCNSYLVLPTAEELAQFATGPYRKKPATGKIGTGKGPWGGFPSTENSVLTRTSVGNKNHDVGADDVVGADTAGAAPQKSDGVDDVGPSDQNADQEPERASDQAANAGQAGDGQVDGQVDGDLTDEQRIRFYGMVLEDDCGLPPLEAAQVLAQHAGPGLWDAVLGRDGPESARVRKAAVATLLALWGINDPKRSEIVRRLSVRPDMIAATCQLWQRARSRPKSKRAGWFIDQALREPRDPPADLSVTVTHLAAKLARWSLERAEREAARVRGKGTHA